MKVLAATTVALAACLSAAPAAFAYETPPPSVAQMSLAPTTIAPGECTHVDGSGFGPGDVTITDNGTVVDQATSDGSGTVDHDLCFPTDATPGDHAVEISGPAPASAAYRAAVRMAHSQAATGRIVTARAILHISGGTVEQPVSLPRTDVGSAGAGSGSTGSLAFTGFPLVGTVLVGVGLVGAGAAATRAGRRTRLG